MKVFISWSGEKSRLAALALRDWLPLVINSLVPFVSDEDIHSGTRWQGEIAGELEASNFGIVCVTKENQGAPWLNFEAGALAKAVDASLVVPLAIDLKLSDVVLPLGQFQAQPATKSGIRKVLASLNAVCDQPLDDERLKRAADKWWSDLEEQLKEIEEKTKNAEPKSGADARSERELIEETLETVRSIARRLDRAPTPQAQSSDRMSADHPVITEIRALADEAGKRIEFALFSRRRLGIAGDPLDADLRQRMVERADGYGIALAFSPRTIAPSESGEEEGEESQDAAE